MQPLTARITTTIASTAERASDEFLDSIRCFGYPRVEHPGREDSEPSKYAVVAFSRSDGLVRFAAGTGEEWMHGTEIESWECL